VFTISLPGHLSPADFDGEKAELKCEDEVELGEWVWVSGWSADYVPGGYGLENLPLL